MSKRVRKILCIGSLICLLLSVLPFSAASKTIESKNILWDFENGTTQSWVPDRPGNLPMSIQTVGGSKALSLEYQYRDAQAQTWWDTAGIKIVSRMNIAGYDAFTVDILLDPSAITGFGYMTVTPCVSTLNWADFIQCESFFIYQTPPGVDTGKLVKVTAVCKIPDNISEIEGIVLWITGAAIDYSGPLYVDNIGLANFAPGETPEPDPVTMPYKTSVQKHGQLQVIGTQLCDEDGEPVQLRGMSVPGIEHHKRILNRAAFQALAYDWKCDVIRLSVDSGSSSIGKYTGTPEQKALLWKGIDLAVETGMYVLVDWHVLTPGNPNDPLYDYADTFFDEVSEKYGDCPNLIYEICNEPNGNITWNSDIKPYAERMQGIIRANDPDNIIVIGTGFWSQDVDIAALNPVVGSNLMYTVHFYTGTHTQGVRDKVQTALDRGIAIFATEWGVSDHTGSGGLFLEESETWLAFLDAKKISWTNWSLSNSGASSSCFVSLLPTGNVYDGVIEKFPCPFVPFTDSGKGYLYWPEEQLSPSGQYIRNKIRAAYVEEPLEQEALTISDVNAGANGVIGQRQAIPFSFFLSGGNPDYDVSIVITRNGRLHFFKQFTATSGTVSETLSAMKTAGTYRITVYAADSGGKTARAEKEFLVML